MAFSNPVDTITMEEIVPVVVDTVLRSNTFTTVALARPKAFKSATQDFPVKYKIGTAAQSFIGLQQLSSAFTDTRVLLKYNPAFVEANVTIVGTDALANNTARKVLDLVQVEMSSRAQDLADFVGSSFYQGGAGTAMNGLLNLVDDGTNYANIGGLSRTTYPTLAGTLTATSGTLSLNKMRTMWYAVGDVAVFPTRIYCDATSWASFELLLQPQERIMKTVNLNSNFKGYTGFDSLEYAGMKVTFDRKCTAGSMYFLNEDYLNFYALPSSDPVSGRGGKPVSVASKLIDGNMYNQVGNLGFFWTGFIPLSNAYGFNSFIILAGNLITDNPRRHGLLSGITGV
jgi:hypothetical protein